jgi:hypothetical protein
MLVNTGSNLHHPTWSYDCGDDSAIANVPFPLVGFFVDCSEMNFPLTPSYLGPIAKAQHCTSIFGNETKCSKCSGIVYVAVGILGQGPARYSDHC